jgi:hypothetical protein
MVDKDVLKERMSKWRKKKVPISIYDYDSIEKVKEILNEILKKK